MATCASFRLFSPKISLPFHPPNNNIPSKSKPRLFSSISIQRLPTKPLAAAAASSPQPVENLPPKLQEIVTKFQSVQESKAKYQQLLFYANNLPPLEPKFKTKENKLQGCVSQVWVRAFLDHDNKVHFQADSDSSLTKGLAALLVQALSGQDLTQILNVPPTFITLLGLQQSLTPSRNNGFLNMLKLMQIKAVQLYNEARESRDSSSDAAAANGVLKEEAQILADVGGSGSGEVELNSQVSLGSRGERIKEILTRELSPAELQIEDISYQHAGHAGVHRNAEETHFNLQIVSPEFEGKSLVKRHRLVYGLLQNELQNGLHALSILAKTPSEVDGT